MNMKHHKLSHTHICLQNRKSPEHLQEVPFSTAAEQIKNKKPFRGCEWVQASWDQLILHLWQLFFCERMYVYLCKDWVCVLCKRKWVCVWETELESLFPNKSSFCSADGRMKRSCVQTAEQHSDHRWAALMNQCEWIQCYNRLAQAFSALKSRVWVPMILFSVTSLFSRWSHRHLSFHITLTIIYWIII